MSGPDWRVRRLSYDRSAFVGDPRRWTVQRRAWLVWRVVGRFATHAEAIAAADRWARPGRFDYGLAR